MSTKDVVEVLVACMNQEDDRLYEKMNLQSDAVLANQCSEYGYKVYKRGSNTVKLVSTDGRGVGRNRNIALLNASGDYLVIADEDMVYKDGYPDLVTKAFTGRPDADIIVFDLNCLNGSDSKKTVTKMKRIRLFNSLRYGAASVSIKKESFLKSNIWFSLLYGGGAQYSCGEDTLFIREALQRRLRIYASPQIIADVRQEQSSWFKGFTEKYFIDRGFWLANAFPLLKYPLGLYYAWRLRNITQEFGIFKLARMIFKGIKAYKLSSTSQVD